MTGEAATAADGTHPTGMHSCYRPQRTCDKVMFLHESVILSTGGCLADTPWADTPLRRHPSQGDTPLRRHPSQGDIP